MARGRGSETAEVSSGPCPPARPAGGRHSPPRQRCRRTPPEGCPAPGLPGIAGGRLGGRRRGCEGRRRVVLQALPLHQLRRSRQQAVPSDGRDRAVVPLSARLSAGATSPTGYIYFPPPAAVTTARRSWTCPPLEIGKSRS